MRIHGVALAGLALVSPAGCVSPVLEPPGPSETVTVTASTEPRATSQVEIEDLDDSELGDRSAVTEASFGQAVKLAYDTGTVFISQPTAFRPGKDAPVRDDWDEFVMMEVTETNDWSAPTMKRWSITAITATTGGHECPMVIDPSLGVGRPEGALEPGESITYTIGFACGRDAQFVVTAMAPIGYDVAVFR